MYGRIFVIQKVLPWVTRSICIFVRGKYKLKSSLISWISGYVELQPFYNVTSINECLTVCIICEIDGILSWNRLMFDPLNCQWTATGYIRAIFVLLRELDIISWCGISCSSFIWTGNRFSIRW